MKGIQFQFYSNVSLSSAVGVQSCTKGAQLPYVNPFKMFFELLLIEQKDM